VDPDPDMGFKKFRGSGSGKFFGNIFFILSSDSLFLLLKLAPETARKR
jgi:hypothetical protein